MKERRVIPNRFLGAAGALSLIILVGAAGCNTRPPMKAQSDPKNMMGDYNKTMQAAKMKRGPGGGMPGGPGGGMPGAPGGMPGAPGGMMPGRPGGMMPGAPPGGMSR